MTPHDATHHSTPGPQPPPAGLTLGLDTSSWVSVGLADPSGIVARRSLADPRAHVEQLMPLVMELLAGAGHALAGLTGIVVGMGPGPYTGLRVGVATAETLAWSLNVPVRHVCSLDILAQQVLQRSRPQPGDAHVTAPDFVTALDARRRELYWARYSAAGHRLEGPIVSDPQQLPELAVHGPGAGLFPGVLAHRAHVDPDAAGVDAALAAFLGAGPTADAALPEVGSEPLYLRRPDASLPGKRKSTLVLPKVRRR